MPKVATAGIRTARTSHGHDHGDGEGALRRRGRIWRLAMLLSLSLNVAFLLFSNAASISGLAMLLSLTMNAALLPLLLSSLYKGPGHSRKSTSLPGATNCSCAGTQGMIYCVARTQREIGIGDASSTRLVSEDAVLDLRYGDPIMFESFWKRVGNQADILISGWQSISYNADATNLCWFLEPEFDRQIRRLHRVVGNAVTDGRHIIVGAGSTQLLQAAMYALSPPDASEPMSVVSAVPYFSSYREQTDFLQSRLFRWAGDANFFRGDAYIELVCSPNNPDGSIREAVLHSKNGKIINDLAYYWPLYTAITASADHHLMLFTVSKSTGHAGTRIGWALVKDEDVATRMTEYIELNSLGVSRDSQLRAAKILKVVSDAYELPIAEDKERLFEYGRSILAMRWKKLREAVKISGIFSLPEFPSATCKFTGKLTETYPAFAWLKCEKVGVEDCEVLFKCHNIIPRSGKRFGSGPEYVRVSMLECDEIFDLFIERLSTIT